MKENKKEPKGFSPPALFLFRPSKTERSMSHARSRAQRCCYCGEYAHYELNHHFPFSPRPPVKGGIK